MNTSPTGAPLRRATNIISSPTCIDTADKLRSHQAPHPLEILTYGRFLRHLQAEMVNHHCVWTDFRQVIKDKSTRFIQTNAVHEWRYNSESHTITHNRTHRIYFMKDKRLPPKPETLRKLYILSGNMCAMPNCTNVLIDKDGTWLGEVAHIHAASDGGPRANTSLSQEERRDAENLILLCRNCHRKIDKNVEQYPAETLIKIKERHESTYIKGLEQAELKDCMDEYTTKLPDSLGAWGIMRSDEEYEDARKSLENVTDRLAVVPLSTREFLVKCLRRSSRSKYPHRREELRVNAEEIRQAISVEGRQISRKTIAEHVKILENYGFACFEEKDNWETGYIIFGDDASVLYTAHRIAEYEQTVRSDGFLSTLETILVRLDFSSFESASREQSTSGKEGPSYKKRRAKNSRHTK